MLLTAALILVGVVAGEAAEAGVEAAAEAGVEAAAEAAARREVPIG